jgi:hypothetical protein
LSIGLDGAGAALDGQSDIHRADVEILRFAPGNAPLARGADAPVCRGTVKNGGGRARTLWDVSADGVWRDAHGRPAPEPIPAKKPLPAVRPSVLAHERVRRGAMVDRRLQTARASKTGLCGAVLAG